tara:strand:- start:160 stop:345 length:186 start_codon:yes stop_codon:yes gene_type:complete
MRKAQLADYVANRRKQKKEHNRWERLPSENNRHEFTSSQPYLERLYRLLPEKKRSVFSRYD